MANYIMKLTLVLSDYDLEQYNMYSQWDQVLIEYYEGTYYKTI